jgi:hypothetical protein
VVDIKIEVTTSRVLRKVLKSYGVVIDTWGESGPTKSVNRLMAEILKGDCILVDRDGCLMRITYRSQARIFRFRDRKVEFLTEALQTFANGHTRRADRPISMSEKYRFWSGETDEEGLLRGLDEELGIVGIDLLQDVQLLIRNPPTIERKSSYLTLPCESNNTLFKVVLPERFWKEEYREVEKEKVTEFRWVEWTNEVPQGTSLVA